MSPLIKCKEESQWAFSVKNTRRKKDIEGEGS